MQYIWCCSASPKAHAALLLPLQVDLLDAQSLAAAEAAVRAVNASATIVKTTFAQVDLGLLLDRGAYRMRLPPIGPASHGDASTTSQPAAAGGAGSKDGGDAGTSVAGVAAGAWDTPSQAALAWLSAAVEAATVTESLEAHGADQVHLGCGTCGVHGCTSHPDNSSGSSSRASSHHHHHSPGHAVGNTAANNPTSSSSGGGGGSKEQACAAHDAAITTVTLRLQRPLDLDKFKQWVEVLLWTQDGAAPEPQPSNGLGPVTSSSSADAQGRPHHQPQQVASDTGASQPGSSTPAAVAPEVSLGVDVLRMKGLVWVKEDPRVHLFQVS